MKKFLFLVFAFVAVGVAYADPDPSRVLTSQYYVDSMLEDKQVAIPAQSGNKAVLYPNSANNQTDGQVQARTISTSLTATGVANDDLPTVGAVNAGLSDKQNKLSGTSGDLVTFTTTSGTVGSQAIYDDTGSYVTGTNGNTSKNLVNAGHVNAAVAEGFRSHMTCTSYVSGYSDAGHCLLWAVDDTMSGTYVPTGTSAP